MKEWASVVTRSESITLQTLLLDLGYEWVSGCKIVLKRNKHILIFQKSISFMPTNHFPWYSSIIINYQDAFDLIIEDKREKAAGYLKIERKEECEEETCL
jgi:hypothetical protein